MSTTGSWYQSRRVLVTGGLGFIGSHLAERLVQLGARVTIVDSMLPTMGGNSFNVRGFRDHVRVSRTDLRDSMASRRLLSGQDCIFNLAGQVSHTDSLAHPEADLDVNCRAHLSLLSALRDLGERPRVVFASTRQIYGRPHRLPVDEQHPPRPVDVNGVHKLAAEQYHLVYGRVCGFPTVSLRLTNTYGPRQLMRHGRQGFIPVFVRRAMEDRAIALYGGGLQVRDANYVSDVIDAFLLAGEHADELDGEILNLGARPTFTLREFAEALIEVVGSGSLLDVPWPDDAAKIDIGSFETDFSRISTELGWKPVVGLEEGLRLTVAFYRELGENYW